MSSTKDGELDSDEGNTDLVQKCIGRLPMQGTKYQKCPKYKKVANITPVSQAMQQGNCRTTEQSCRVVGPLGTEELFLVPKALR